MLRPLFDDLRMKYTLSRFTVKPEKIRETKRALAELVSSVRSHEPKTLYIVYRAETNHTFLLLMSFESEAAERLHAQSKYVARFARKLLPLCEGARCVCGSSNVAATCGGWRWFMCAPSKVS